MSILLATASPDCLDRLYPATVILSQIVINPVSVMISAMPICRRRMRERPGSMPASLQKWWSGMLGIVAALRGRPFVTPGNDPANRRFCDGLARHVCPTRRERPRRIQDTREGSPPHAATKARRPNRIQTRGSLAHQRQLQQCPRFTSRRRRRGPVRAQAPLRPAILGTPLRMLRQRSIPFYVGRKSRVFESPINIAYSASAEAEIRGLRRSLMHG